MYAVLDIGSNTIRLGIYVIENNKPKQIYNEADMASLASYRKYGEITEQGILVAAESINKFVRISKEYNVLNIFAFATASLRNVSNTEYAAAKIKELTNIEIDVITGEKEAYLDFLGTACDTDTTNGVMLDIGGGSSEVVVYSNGTAEEMLSMPIGSLTLYNDYVLGDFPDKNEREIIKNTVLSFQNKNTAKKYKELLGVGGTAKAAEMVYEELYGNRAVNLKELICLSAEQPDLLYKAIQKTVPKRIKTFVPGIVVFDVIMDYYELSEIKISICGVKEGYLRYKLGI